MLREMVENKLMAVFNENGLCIDDKNMLLQDYFPDSLVFVSIIVGIEEEFELELPDEMLLIENMGTFNTLLERVCSLIDYKEASDNL